MYVIRLYFIDREKKPANRWLSGDLKCPTQSLPHARTFPSYSEAHAWATAAYRRGWIGSWEIRQKVEALIQSM